MREITKRTIIRFSKAVHFCVTVLLFVGCISLFYPEQNQVLQTVLYFAIALFSVRTYNALQIGLSRVRMLVYSQTLADVVAVGLLYLLMVFERGSLFVPAPLAGLLAVQFVWNILWSVVANAIYFRLYQARRTAIVYWDAADLKRLDEIYRYDRKFRVEQLLQASSGSVANLEAALCGFEAVFVTGVPEKLQNEIELYCVERNIRCYVMPHVGDVILMGAKHMELFSVPVFRITRAAPAIEYVAIKRGVDILCSLLGLVVLSPLILGTALAVKLYDGGPVIYKQVRLTKDRRQFHIYKFRSMRVNAEGDGVARLAAHNDSRITPVGRVIRACRLDELPQLFNILRGDMSIVGPRPERPEIAMQYEAEMPSFSLRLQVRAGLTGLAQVYGKYNTDPYDKLRMDLMYINQMSLMEDLKLVFATVKVLFLKESTTGISQGQTTAAAQSDTAEYAVK